MSESELETGSESLANEEEATAELFGAEGGEQQAEQTEHQETQEQERPKKLVPLEALHEARKEAKEYRERARAQDEKMARMEERFNWMLQNVGKREQSQQAPQIPDKIADPIGHFDQRAMTLEQRVKAAEDWKAQQEQQSRQQSQFQHFTAAYQSQAREFASRQADWPDAYRHFTDSVMNELKAAGFTDPQILMQQANSYEQAIVAQAMREGVNPAERIYSVTKQFRGYAPKGSVSGENKIETLRAGQKAGSGFARAGGNARTEISTLEQLAEIKDPKEFDKAWNKLIGDAA